MFTRLKKFYYLKILRLKIEICLFQSDVCKSDVCPVYSLTFVPSDICGSQVWTSAFRLCHARGNIWTMKINVSTFLKNKKHQMFQNVNQKNDAGGGRLK